PAIYTLSLHDAFRSGQRSLTLHELDGHLDRRERVVDLVGHAREECAERRELVGLDELGLSLLELRHPGLQLGVEANLLKRQRRLDRKSTRLNSSHVA